MARGLQNGRAVNGYVSHSKECKENGTVDDRRATPDFKKEDELCNEEYEETPLLVALVTYFGYGVFVAFGHLRDLLRSLGIEAIHSSQELNREGYVPLYQSFESFYTRNLCKRICDIWDRPICSVPGVKIILMERIFTDLNWKVRLGKGRTEALNMGSYNYLGFAENRGYCCDRAEEVIKSQGIGVASTRHELGTLKIVKELECCLARFLGVEDSIVFGMGFATNSTSIPCIIGKGCLILSDELNHASLVLGCRLSGGYVKVFKHNDMKDLEETLRTSILEGQPRTQRPWKKIFIIVEAWKALSPIYLPSYA